MSDPRGRDRVGQLIFNVIRSLSRQDRTDGPITAGWWATVTMLISGPLDGRGYEEERGQRRWSGVATT